MFHSDFDVSGMDFDIVPEPAEDFSDGFDCGSGIAEFDLSAFLVVAFDDPSGFPYGVFIDASVRIHNVRDGSSGHLREDGQSFVFGENKVCEKPFAHRSDGGFDGGRFSDLSTGSICCFFGIPGFSGGVGA